MGRMLTQREVLDVVEVPAEWCDDILGPPADMSKNVEQMTTHPPLSGQDTDTVALILGGVSSLPGEAGEILSSAELFGCPGYQGKSKSIEDYPLPV